MSCVGSRPFNGNATIRCWSITCEIMFMSGPLQRPLSSPLRDFANLHTYIDLVGVTHLQGDAILHVSLKTRGGNFERVGPDWQAREAVDAAGVRCRIRDRPGVDSSHLTVAPGTIAPVESVMRPVIEAIDTRSCARRIGAWTRNRRTNNALLIAVVLPRIFVIASAQPLSEVTIGLRGRCPHHGRVAGRRERAGRTILRIASDLRHLQFESPATNG